MAATALDIITRAFRKIGVYAPGETITDADAEDGLTILNDMLDSWSNESLACYTILEQSGVLIPGVYQYTIGPGGAFNITRPLKLIDGPGSAYILDSNGMKYDIEILTREGWNLIGQLTNINSNIPTQLFYDPQYPLGVLNFYPTPNQTVTAYWDSYLQLTEFASLTAQISFPPGYKKAIQDNLAIELIPDFKGDTFQVPALWLKQAMDSKAAVKRTNIRPITAYFDRELVAKGTGTYNIYSDRGG